MTVLERGHPARWLTIALLPPRWRRARESSKEVIVLKAEPMRTAPRKRVVINPQPQLATSPMAQLVRSVM